MHENCEIFKTKKRQWNIPSSMHQFSLKQKAVKISFYPSFCLSIARISKFLFSDDSIKTVELKKTKKSKDPPIKSGQALPENGTCKHYKKSFRWMRFPCCGKCYPCDKCHEDAEGGHEMEQATRMICGFCSKEQVKNTIS